MTRDAVVHVLPGLGASSAMYAGAWRELPSARFHDWTSAHGATELGDAAAALVAAAPIAPGDVVVGTSLGGMVACEIAAQVPLGALVLVSSAVHPSEVNRVLALLHPLARVAPVEFAQRAAGKLPAELARMFAEGDATFMRAMCAAVFRWRGLAPTLPPPFRIHGRADRVIPPPPSPDVLLEGGHLVAISDAARCVAAVRAHLAV